MASIEELQRRAIEFARAGDFGAEALATNLELAKAAPTNEGALTRLSRCYMEGGQLDEATATLDAAVQLNPQNTIARSLQVEVTKRRMATMPVVKVPRPRAAASRHADGSPGPAARRSPTRAGQVAGIGRAEFAALGQLASAAVVESLGSRLEPLLMALNERPFAAKAVDTRNRAGHSGARLFRRNTIHSGGPGLLRAFHQGARWEPQLTIALFSATPWGRDALCAGIGFRLAPQGSDADQERALAQFAQFQQLLAGTWRSFLSQWMSMNGGFIQYGETPPATSLLPNDALSWLIACQQPADIGWVFYGRWLFLDRAQDAETLAEGRRLVAWIDSTFSDLLPVWTSLYRS
jgi:tetratricopeptide (TPR) repeat protein